MPVNTEIKIMSWAGRFDPESSEGKYATMQKKGNGE